MPQRSTRTGRFTAIRRALTVAVLGGIFATSVVSALAEDAEAPQVLPFKPYMTLRKSEYFPPEQGGGKQLVRLTLSLSPDVPVGTKLNFQLTHQRLPVAQTQFELKTAKREGVIFDWRLDTLLGVDRYFLEVQMPLVQQTPAVQEKIRSQEKRFPLRHDPWVLSLVDDKYAIQVGTAEEAAKQVEDIKKFYDSSIAELIANMNEFVDAMQAVKDGKKFKRGIGVDENELKSYVKAWCKKQAKTQKAIKDFMADQPALFTKTRRAHLELEQLGRMVSRRAHQLQKEVTDQYKIPPIELGRATNDRSDEILMYFDRAYRFTPNKKHLNAALEKIYAVLEPITAPPKPPEKPAEKKPEKKPEEKPGAAKTSPEKKTPA